jgi:hypothetical protein
MNKELQFLIYSTLNYSRREYRLVEIAITFRIWATKTPNYSRREYRLVEIATTFRIWAAKTLNYSHREYRLVEMMYTSTPCIPLGMQPVHN